MWLCSSSTSIIEDRDPSTHLNILTTRINSRTLETRAKKDGKDMGVMTYEVSADGKTLTSKYSTSPQSPQQVVVFDRQE
jgi:hypothetical protein